jgi:hypothetical protein
MPQYIVRLFDAEGHATHSHTIVAASPDAIIRKVASLYPEPTFSGDTGRQ